MKRRRQGFDDRPVLMLEGVEVLYLPPLWELRPQDPVVYYVHPHLPERFLPFLRMTALRNTPLACRWPRAVYPPPLEASPLPAKPLRMFCDYSPWPVELKYVDGWTDAYQIFIPPSRKPLIWADSTAVDECAIIDVATVVLKKYAGDWWDDVELHITARYGWEPVTRTVVMAGLREWRVCR